MSGFFNRLFGTNKTEGADTDVPVIENDNVDLYEPTVVGFSSIEQQQLCYGAIVTCGYDPSQHTVLDIGCGRADMYEYITNFFGNGKPKRYTGVDANPDMIQLATEKLESLYGTLDNVALVQSDHFSFLSGDDIKEGQYDWVFCSNTLNSPVFDVDRTDIDRELTQMTYAEHFLSHTWNTTSRGVVFSVYTNPFVKNQMEGSIWSWDKGKLLEMVDRLFGGQYVVRCDYLLPNHMTIILYKKRG